MTNENNNMKAFPKRKAISQSLRFEVFKRDSFTCQYCGKKAPDVVLHVDHIQPVADGGENDILNLITSCAACNGGKGARLLEDSTVIDKQRQQLEELNERRAQLEMMIQWRDELHNLSNDYVQAIQDEFLKYGPFTANETAERDILRWTRRYKLDEIFNAIESSFTQYLKVGDDGNVTGESWSRAFDKVPRIIEMNRRGGLSEPMKSIFYARGIVRNRFSYVDENNVIWLMKSAVEQGLITDDLIDLAKRCHHWKEFEDVLWKWIFRDDDGKNS